MNPARISGKKLVWVGGTVLVIVAASARLFAVFYMHDMRAPLPAATQPATLPTEQQP